LGITSEGIIFCCSGPVTSGNSSFMSPTS
jgi:hypothetical protein